MIAHNLWCWPLSRISAGSSFGLPFFVSSNWIRLLFRVTLIRRPGNLFADMRPKETPLDDIATTTVAITDQEWDVAH